MTVSHLSHTISYFGKNLQNSAVLFHVGLLRMNFFSEGERHFIKQSIIFTTASLLSLGNNSLSS